MILNIQNNNRLPCEGIGSGIKLKLWNSCSGSRIGLQYRQVATLHFFIFKINVNGV